MAFAPNYALLTDLGELRQLAGRVISEGKPLGYDIETGYEGETREKAAIHPEENFVVGISFTNALTWARYVPVRHDAGVNVDAGEVAAILWEMLTATGEDGEPLGVAHHAKFELRVLARWFLRNLALHPRLGPEVIAALGYTPVRSCTMLESYAEGENRTHGLKDITVWTFGHFMTEILDLFPQGLTKAQQKSIRFNPLDQHDPKVVNYACEDALWALAHHLHRHPSVKDSLIYKTEMEVLREAACVMEDTGLDYDWGRMREAGIAGREFAGKYLAEVQHDFEEWLGRPLDPKFNFGSPQQLAWLLYGAHDKLTGKWGQGLGLPVSRKTKTGAPSTEAKTALKDLSAQHAPVKKLLNYKALLKLVRDFLEKFEAKYSFAADGRAHPSLLQHGTVTGRTSKNDPNDQQSPKKYKYALTTGETFEHSFRDNIRAPRPGMRLWWQIILEELGAWSPAPEDDLGWYILGFDWSMMELRVMAGESGETALIEAFRRGDDLHNLTAGRMLGKPPGQVTDEERTKVGKTFNFGISYGMEAKGIADRLGCAMEEAEALLAQFWAAYPRLRQWRDRIVADSKKNGYVTTHFGRKVKIWEYEDADMLSGWAARSRRSAGERTAGNAPVQGAAAGDYKKITMVRAQKALKAAGLAGKVLLAQDVHDELEWYVRKDVAPAAVIAVLRPAVEWDAGRCPDCDGWPPMVAEWHVGERWGSLIELEILPDGAVRAKGKAEVAEARPDEDPGEEDQEEWESAPLLPARPPAGARAPVPPVPLIPTIPPAGPAAPEEHPAPARAGTQPRTVIVELSRMPAADQVGRFTRLARQVPGPNTVIVRVPQGDIKMPGVTGLSPATGAEVSIIFGGAMTYYDLDSVDMAELAAGLDL